MPSAQAHYDFETLIIGAGTAGARLARRLSDAGFSRIAVVEAGGTRTPVQAKVPAWYPWCFGSSIDWCYATIHQSELLVRRIGWPRGRIVGGSGAINALIDIQSGKQDWQRWGWDWANQSSCRDDPLSPEHPTTIHPWSERFLAACEESGLQCHQPLTQVDRNSCGRFLLARRNGQRIHAGQQLSDLAQVTLITHSEVLELIPSNDRVVGLRVISRVGSNLETITAKRFILCAGTVGTPLLLQRSGIGNCDVLKDSQINCHVNSPGVGKNLQDHLVVPIVYQARSADGLPRIHGPEARSHFRVDGSGSMTSNIAEATAFKSLSADHTADYQIHFTPTHYWKYPRRDDGRRFLSLNITDLHPRSRGAIRLARDTSGAIQTVIDPRYLSHRDDLLRFSAALSWAKSIAEQSALAEIIDNPYTIRSESSKEHEAVFRKFSQSIYHPVGTCAMESPLDVYEPVVDSHFKFKGLENLWVADASVLPDLPSCNPNRTILLLADRLAKLLIEC